ncbi:MAG: flagellar brake protein [Methylococcaceae bacterium]
MSNLSSYGIQNQRQISNSLSSLIKNKCLLSVSIDNCGETYITTLLSIDEKNHTLVLDYGPSEQLNHRILSVKEVRFDTQYRGIKVWFTGASLKKTTYKGDPAFIMPIPNTLFWMERRSYYRVKMPLSNISICHLIGEEDSEPINIKVYDISLSGFSTLDDHKEIFDRMTSETLFQGKLMFLDLEDNSVSFKVCYNQITNPNKLRPIYKIGFKFLQISPLVEDAIQRHLIQLQREHLKKYSDHAEA